MQQSRHATVTSAAWGFAPLHWQITLQKMATPIACGPRGRFVGKLIIFLWFIFATVAYFDRSHILLKTVDRSVVASESHIQLKYVDRKSVASEKHGVRDCVTGTVLFESQEIPQKYITDIKDMSALPVKQETDNERQASFEKVFKKKEWGVEPEKGIGGLQVLYYKR